MKIRMTVKRLKTLIDEGYKLDQSIKKDQDSLNQIKVQIKKYAETKDREKFIGNDHYCLVFDKPYGNVKSPLKVWHLCKGNKKLFFSLIKVLVTRLEDTFDEKVIKRLVEYNDVKCISFRE